MTTKELNQYFDARRLLTSGQYEVLVKAGQVFITESYFTAEMAHKHLWPQSEREIANGKAELMRLAGMTQEQADAVYAPEGRYGGYIFTDTATWEEAKEWAIKRGMGETVKGRLGGAIPLDDSRSQRNAQLN